MVIRQETPDDYGEVYDLVKAAFTTSSDDGEWDYLNCLRTKDCFIPELSLVAEEQGELHGQVALTKTDITTPTGAVTQLLLSPLSVHPLHFRQGIARALLEEAFQRAARLGYGAVFLCGDPCLYQRFGFRPSWEFGILHAADHHGDAPWCMAIELVPGVLKGIKGTIDIV